jgi:hypothetical protein
MLIDIIYYFFKIINFKVFIFFKMLFSRMFDSFFFLIQNITFLDLLILIFLIYFVIKVKNRVVKVEKEDKGIDSALNNPEDDCLRRDSFAKNIFNLISFKEEDVKTHLRVGILGDWGSGKTTVMNFIKFYCQEKKYPVAEFHPWQFHSRKEAWEGFLASINKGIEEYEGKKRFKSKKNINFLLEKAKDLIDIFNPKVAKIMEKLILSPLKNQLDETKTKVSKALEKVFGNKKFYIFIDDLDRAEPEIIYDMLMLLNEIININQCVFIIGIDPQSVLDILKKKFSYEKAEEFLDKIINWKFELPLPADRDWKYFLESEIKNGLQELKQEEIRTVLEFFPKNPRKFKYYLRYVDNLHRSFLKRFNDDDGLNWKLIYLGQLLRVEFPVLFRKFFQEKILIKEIADGNRGSFIERTIKSASGNTKQIEKPKWEEKIETFLEENNCKETEKFKEIFIAMKNCVYYSDEFEIKKHLMVSEDLELMSWKEYFDFINEIKEEQISSEVKIKKFFINCINKREIEKAREFVNMLVRDRNNLFRRIMDFDIEEEMKKGIVELNKITKLLQFVLNSMEVFSVSVEPLFDEKTLTEWYDGLVEWAHVKEPKILYESIRQDEEDLVINLIKENLFQSENIAEWLYFKLKKEYSTEPKKAFENTRKKIKKILDNKLAKDIINRFEKINGIKELLDRNKFILEKILLLNESSVFHKQENYMRLNIIAKKAKNNLDIQNNFIECLRILLYGIADSMGYNEITSEKIISLIKKETFVEIIWNAAICNSLNKRTVRTFEDYLENNIEKQIDNKNLFTRPKWWNESILE